MGFDLIAHERQFYYFRSTEELGKEATQLAVFFFVLVMFVIAQVFTNTGLDRRFAYWLLAKAGGSTRRTVLLFMVGTAALSTVVSDVPCCAVFMAVALGLFDKMGLQAGTSHFAKCLMIGIPIASLIGGVGTPAGSSVNILGLTFIERYGQVRVPFVHWMAIGIPMVIVLVPVAAAVILWFYPPELDRVEGVDFRVELDTMGPLDRRGRRRRSGRGGDVPAGHAAVPVMERG